MDEGLLNDLLECSVCLERLDTSSRVLPCQHTFCIKCLKEILHSHKELRCPECRVLVEIRVEDLPPNVLLMRILEGMRGSHRTHEQQASPVAPLQQHHLHNLHHHQPHHHHQHHQQLPKQHQNTRHHRVQLDAAPGFTYSSGQGDGGKQAYVIPATTPHARAVYDYLSKEPGDLSFKKGDVIILRKRIDTHWYHGESGGKQGAFPITYAQIVVPLPPAVPHCKALYDFRMAPPDEEGCLAFDKGAMIIVIRRVDENWAEGKLDNRIGIFPIAFVEMNAPARSLMKLSSNSASGSSRVAPPTPPADSSKPPILNANLSTNSSNINTPTRQVQPSSIIQSVQFAQQRANAAGYRPAIQIQQLHNAFRQQQMSLSSPVPAPAAQLSQQNMSQSHPNYLHQQANTPSQPAPRLQTSVHESSQQSGQKSDMYDWTAGLNRNLENPYTSIVPTVMLDGAQNASQSTQYTQVLTSTNTVQENQGQSSSTNAPTQQNDQQLGFQNSNKPRGNIKQFTNLSSSYHATNNLSSDSSSTTTTPSFGGSSVTTTPNTSSSNTSSASESNTPSSPASPAYSSHGRTNTLTTVTEANNTLNTSTEHTQSSNQYYNVALGQVATPQRSTSGHIAREDADTSNDSGNNTAPAGNLSNSGSPLLNIIDLNNRSSPSCNSSPIQNVSSNATPPRSNMSSPQTCTVNQSSNANQPSGDSVHNSTTPQHHHNPNNRHHGLIYQNVPFSNSGYTLMSNTSAPNVSSAANPFINSQLMTGASQDLTNPSSAVQSYPVFYNLNEHGHSGEPMQGMISPRHIREGPLVSVPRSSHGYHHRDKEKRHSLTPGGQITVPQHTSHNRHSAEILSPTSGNLLDLEPPAHNHSGLKRDVERDRHNQSGEGRDHQERGERASGDKREREKDKDKHKKRSGSADRQLPGTYIALYPYKPQKADELELKKGGVYMVLERCQDGWYKGCSNRTQKCGVFPGNYVAPASKSLQPSVASSSSPRNRQQGASTQAGMESKTSSSSSGAKLNSSTNPSVQSASSGGGTGNMKNPTGSESAQSSSPSPHFQLQPPDLPPRSVSPGASNASPSSGFSWSMTPKSSSSSKSAEKSKEKSKPDKSALSGGVSIMKRLAAMKKCRSPPPHSGGFSMDNPVFEDCTPLQSGVSMTATGSVTTNQQGESKNGASHHPVHVRSGSCPSQLLEGAPASSNLGSQPELRSNRPQVLSPQPHQHHHLVSNVLFSGGSVSSAVAHRLFPAHHLRGSGSQTLGPSQAASQRRHARPSVFNATLAADSDQVAATGSLKPGYATGRNSGDVPWLPVSTRHNHHRKSHSLDAGHQAKSGKEASTLALRERFRCIVAYPPNSEYELELRVDDVVVVSRKWGDGWYKGTLERTGRTGLFPASFVEAC